MTRTRDREPAFPPGFFYVNQDNYCLVRMRDSAHRYLYSDGATSCVIVILQGRDAAGEDIALLAHVSDPNRIDVLFRLVPATFVGPVAVWAQGANPPSAEASVVNARILMRWLSERAQRERVPDHTERLWFFDHVHLAIGQGDPVADELHAFGFDLDRSAVSRRIVRLTPEQRDPTGGMQALFSMFGQHLEPRVLLWNAEEPFPWSLQCSLVETARKAHWERLARMSDEEILYACSTTPTCEVPWLAPSLRASAELVLRFDPSRNPEP
jgi:hypothetical protein